MIQTDGVQQTSESDNSFLTALPTLVVGLGMVAFLGVSYALFKRRMRFKRKKDIEYMHYYLNTHPDITREQYEKTKCLPVRNKVTVMTNTHLVEINELLVVEKSEHDDADKDVNNSRKCRRKYGKRGSRKRSSFKADSSKHEDTQMSRARDINYSLEGNESEPSKINDTHENVQGKKQKSKRRKKKFLRLLTTKYSTFQAGSSPEYRPVELEMVANSQMGAMFRTNKKEKTSKREIALNSSPISEKDSIHQNSSGYTENAYYEDSGLSVNQTKVRKKSVKKAAVIKDAENILNLSKPDNLKGNAFYDRVTLAHEPKEQYKELTHRDSHGNLTFLARSLPHLDSEYNQNIDSEGKGRIEKGRSKSEVLDYLHQSEYDVLF